MSGEAYSLKSTATDRFLFFFFFFWSNFSWPLFSYLIKSVWCFGTETKGLRENNIRMRRHRANPIEIYMPCFFFVKIWLSFELPLKTDIHTCPLLERHNQVVQGIEKIKKKILWEYVSSADVIRTVIYVSVRWAEITTFVWDGEANNLNLSIQRHYFLRFLTECLTYGLIISYIHIIHPLVGITN